MRGFRLAAVTGILSVLIQACDYINPTDFKEGSQVQVSKWDMDTSYLQRDSVQPQMVLLEEYTGQACGQCPPANLVAKKLDSTYKDLLHVMSIHAGYFADPVNNPNGNDLRCEAGNFLDTKFQISESVPKALINRGRFGKAQVEKLNPSSWQSKIDELINRPAPDFTMYLHPYYDANADQFFAVTRVKFRKQVEDSVLLALYLVEDSIINWQLDYSKNPPPILDYAHRHVLRDAFTPIGGSGTAGALPYLTGKVSTGRWVLDRRSVINRKKCTVVAIAYRQDTDEILQAAEMEIEDRQ